MEVSLNYRLINNIFNRKILTIRIVIHLTLQTKNLAYQWKQRNRKNLKNFLPEFQMQWILHRMSLSLKKIHVMNHSTF